MGPVTRSARWTTGLIALAVAVALVAAQAASAATFTVGTTSDTTGTCPNPAGGTCSLRQLITYENNAGTNDTIVVPAGTYTISSVLTITGSVYIQGAGARTTSIQESAGDRVFVVQPPNAASVPIVTISGLAIKFGVGAFGGDVLNQGDLTLSEDAITAGSASSGGGVSNDGGTLTVTHTLVSSNSSSSGGADSGGIQNFGPNPVTGTAGTLEVDNSTISNNTRAPSAGESSVGAAAATARARPREPPTPRRS